MTRRPAMTITEVLVAVVIVTMSCGLVSQTFVSWTQIQTHQKQYDTALREATNAMQLAATLPAHRLDLPSLRAVCDEAGIPARLQKQQMTMQFGFSEGAESQLTPHGMAKIICHVTWSHHGGLRQVQLVRWVPTLMPSEHLESVP